VVDALSFILGFWPAIVAAAWLTVALTVLSSVLAAAVALPLAIVRESRSPFAGAVGMYSWILQAVPVLVILYFGYYGLPRLGVTLPAFQTAILAMGISSSAYQIEIFRAGIVSVPREQFEAAHALGLPSGRLWLRIVLPQAMSVIIPPYISNLTTVLKGTSLASVITVQELSGVGLGIITSTLRPYEVLIAVSVIYLAMNSVLTTSQRILERRLARYKD